MRKTWLKMHRWVSSSLLTLAIALAFGTAAGPSLAQERDEASQAPAAPSAAERAAAIERARAVEREVQALAERTSPSFLVVSGGSGVLISEDGYALTNHHVVSTRAVGDRFWVRRGGGERLRATLVAIDPRGDIALLKCESSGKLPFLPLGDSDALRAGDAAIALGNPYGFAAREAEPTVTLGIISSVHAYRQNYSDAIQTDAAINPGNSGGPLLNMAGEVVGINGRVAVRFGNRMNTGVGYAIASNQIKRFLPRLKAGGTVSHGAIPGLVLSDAGDGAGGARVDDVTRGSLAASAGFAKGDVVVRMDDRAITSANSFYGALGRHPAEETIELEVQRGDERRKIPVKLAVYGARPGATEASGPSAAQLGRLGLRVLEPTARGAQIVNVERGSAAAAAGLRTGDVLVRIEGKALGDGRSLADALSGLRPGGTAAIEVLRGGKELGIALDVPAR